LAAYAYRRGLGLPVVKPKAGMGLVENFLYMLFEKTPDPVLVRALDVLFILHADHEQNCSTSTMRLVGSSHADPFTSLSAAAGALFGPLHGGANEAVLKMLRQIQTVENIPEFIARVKAGEGRLMGFGHRVYKNYDPRARIVKQTADAVFAVTGKNPLLDVAVELERIALSDEYFVKRKLYPNVDFYSGLIYEAMGFPADLFTVLFGVARTSGWLSQWEELLCDEDQKIGRPRQIYLGEGKRDYVTVENRK
jgi:citrate synthase